jgi:NADH:ubiquinone oxidoreductase subunit 5 (subunit L)/multisubunit Na+/H+ antiporter MnhA subunit
MEGPTPVSALLHAATMVTAGIYLTIRCSALLVEANNVCCFIVLIGALTAVMSASIALMQDDIKKIIAYSTCSQLGYMYFSAGLLNFEVSFYHLINHAFFKALLFLSAGAIIHSLNDEQDLKKMGGLVNLLPFTYSVLIIASLAIMGFPYLTGFYSKDLLLELNFINNNTIVSGFSLFIALFTALLTNLYSLRLLYLVFFSRCNSKRILIKYVHDSPLFMMIPQFILAVFTIFVGFLLSDSFVGMGTDM